MNWCPPGLGLPSISFQTVPSGPIVIRWFSTSVSFSAVNNSFFPCCPGHERLFIIFNSDSVVNSFSSVSMLFSVAEVSCSSHSEQSSSMSVIICAFSFITTLHKTPWDAFCLSFRDNKFRCRLIHWQTEMYSGQKDDSKQESVTAIFIRKY